MSSHRGSYRGSYPRHWRGRGRCAGSASRPAPPLKPLGPAIDSIDVKTLLIEEEAPTIQDADYIASYNWLDFKSPVILIPGSPPTWTPLTTDRRLKPDSQAVFRDINAARFASFPLEPMVRSVRTMNPDFDLRSVDIVGCGSTIGNLLRFTGSQSKPFRFDVDMIGDAVLLVRKESTPTELITDLRGYGHTFPEEYTTWDAGVKNSCSHQRIIRYEFGGLHLLVRSETDGYVKQPDAQAASSPKSTENQSNLEDALATMTVTGKDPSKNSKLEIRLAGTKIGQDQIFDLKTRAGNRLFDMDEIIPRLWVNQTPKFLIAYHNFGLFDKPEVEDVREKVLVWEKTNCILLGRFHALLKRIVDVVRDSEKKQCEVSWDGEGPLHITEQIGEGRRALPSDLVQLLEDAEESVV